MKKQSRLSGELKTKILKEHLEDGKPVSDLAEKYGVHVNAIYTWKKQLFEQNVPQVQKERKKEIAENAKDARISELESKLNKRDELIAELLADNIDLKKKGLGLISNKSGSSRK